MIIYIGNDKTQRKEMVGYVHTKIRVAEKFGRCSSVIRLDWMKKIEAVMKRQEEIIEEQEERIAIMEEGGWIPVTKRLPQDDEDVLVWVNGTHRDMAYRDEGVWYDEEHNHLKNITHWMPLPKPPKEGE